MRVPLTYHASRHALKLAIIQVHELSEIKKASYDHFKLLHPYQLHSLRGQLSITQDKKGYRCTCDSDYGPSHFKGYLNLLLLACIYDYLTEATSQSASTVHISSIPRLQFSI